MRWSRRKDLDTEMTVVRNEYERGENSPITVLLKRMQSIAYDWHNYGNSTIGNRSDIENVDITHLQAFYRTYYQPDNAVLLVAGKFDPAKTLQLVNQLFRRDSAARRAQLPKLWTVEPTQDGERSFVVRRVGDLARWWRWATRCPRRCTRTSQALDFRRVRAGRYALRSPAQGAGADGQGGAGGHLRLCRASMARCSSPTRS